MKTLIIDNYDSFTYNLFHLFAEATGQEPTVVLNDDPGWEDGWLAAFDQVVLSPGPGHPGVAGDMGLSRRVIAGRGHVLPLLGICLGFQGICLQAGAQVVVGDPMHGLVSEVVHDGSPLFKGIPTRFAAVRYHSLRVEGVPAGLTVTARTHDGVPMAVEHRTLPHYGVQFHPESACSAHGLQLIQNFCALSQAWRAGKEEHSRRLTSSTRPPQGRSFVNRKASNGRWGRAERCELFYQRWMGGPSPEEVYARVYAGRPHTFWLDSNGGADRGLSRVSVMGGVGGPLSRVATGTVAGGRVVVQDGAGATLEAVEGGVLGWLQEDLERWRLPRAAEPELAFDVRPGWFGHLGYELKGECGGAQPTEAAAQPDLALVFADRILVFDHASATWHALALVGNGEQGEAEAWAATIGEVLATPTQLPALVPLPAGQQLRLRHSPAEYLQRIAACQEQIRRGETYEVCLTNMLEFELAADVEPLAAYRGLRRANPTGFSALLCWPQWSVLSFSPERFLRIDPYGMVESRPMKGTWQRDEQVAVEALSDEQKNRAENLMIVDLVRNDLGRCAELCAVDAGPLFTLETYATVHQLVSTIRARLHSQATPVDCVRAAFPGGSMTGAPKIRTMALLDQLEQGPRGIYSGAIGYLGVNGAVDLSIVIRTLVLRGRRAMLGCGGAITALSDPRAELAETALKSTPLLAPFGLCFPDCV